MHPSLPEHIDEIDSPDVLAPFVPSYFKRVAAAVKRGTDKATLMAEGYEDYIRLTEDVIWSLVSAAADSRTVPVLQLLAQKLVVRDILPHFAVNVGKMDLLRETLLQEGLVDGRDFHLLDLKTTMYKGDDDERVFVLDWQGQIEEVGEHSDTISAFRDRPEAESLLIVIDTTKAHTITKLGRDRQFIIVRDSSAFEG